TAEEIKALIMRRSDACVSLYVPTDSVTQNTAASRIELRNLAKTALGQLRRTGFDKRRLASLEELVAEIQDDDDFWRVQANSLGIFLTPDSMDTFRLPNRLSATAQVSDRFHVKPLLRAVSFPFAAFVLAIAQDSVRLIEIARDRLAAEVKVPGLPRDMSHAVGRTLPRDPAPTGRIQGREGYKVLLRQYARRIDLALRPLLAGRNRPMILATVPQTAAVYRSVNHYPGLMDAAIKGNTEHMSVEEIAQKARSILAAANEQAVRALVEQFVSQRAAGLASSDLVQVARAAVAGAVATLLVDIDETIPGKLDPATGAVTFEDSASARSYDVLGEIAGLTIINGGDVVGVRKADLPGNVPLAALLRYRI
ncbi:MAG TPA: hypothetical protein VMP10_03365, partial [Chloroflexota bacterium]|nr:hypothetical protein [Chloroflexota bacterium]